MSLTLGLTGMDPATETALKAAFIEANEWLSGQWQLVAEADADHIMVDMDSMYGPMSWLRLHAAGKQVIGLTTAGRTQTDFRLGRPFDSQSFSTLLREIAEKHGIKIAVIHATAPAYAPAPAPALVAAEMAAAKPVAPEVMPAPPPVTPAMETPAPPVAAAQASPPSRDPAFADWLEADALSQRVSYRRDNGPLVLIDPQARTYHGPMTLKPFAAYFDGSVRREDFVPVSDSAWTAESTAAGVAQPLARLQWLGALVAGKGALLPGYDPAARYGLGKWPQTEREYPKHFRIATAMMKGPATIPEIAAASGMPVEDVADFVNANLVTGFATPVVETAPEPEEPVKSGGLLGRLRGR